MPRPKPFSKADIEQRGQLSKRTISAHSSKQYALLTEEPSFDAAHEQTIAAFIENTLIHDDRKDKFRNEIRASIHTYWLRRLQHKQELPARQEAILERVLSAAERARRRRTPSTVDDLQKQLDALPPGLRMELHVEDMPRDAIAPWLDRLIDAVEKRLIYWRRHVQHHRPAGEGEIGLALRQSLLDILERYSDMREADARWREADALRRVEELLNELGLRVPVVKKNRALFTGKPSRKIASVSATRRYMSRAVRRR